jgi:hypothetical protein
MKSKIGLLAKLIKQQADRPSYFSLLPIGTLFIIIEEIDTPGYDLTGYFIRPEIPHIIADGSYYFTGYIERGSWEIIGEIKDHIELLKTS